MSYVCVSLDNIQDSNGFLWFKEFESFKKHLIQLELAHKRETFRICGCEGSSEMPGYGIKTFTRFSEMTENDWNENQSRINSFLIDYYKIGVSKDIVEDVKM